MARSLLVTCLLIAVYANVVSSFKREEYDSVVRFVMRNARPYHIPTDGAPLEVTLGLDLTAIREVDTTRGELEITAMRTLQWKNPYLEWQAQFPDVAENPIPVDIKNIWSPDITAYNSVTASELLSPPLALVSSNGSVLYVPNERIRFQCDLEKFYTREGTNCTLNYGSWTQNGHTIDIKPFAVTTESLRDDPRFDLMQTYIEREVTHYDCCPEPYVTVKITLKLRKRRFSLETFNWF